MNLVRALRPPLQAVAPGPSMDTTAWLEAFRSSETQAGKTVTVPAALGSAAVWAAIRVLSDTIGSLPLLTYERLADDSRQRADEEAVYRLLKEQPNAEMTAADCWSLVTAHLNSWGNSYLGKSFLDGRVSELWPIRPDRVRVAREGGRKVFYLKDAAGVEETRRRTQLDIIHIRGLSLDGLVGLSPIQQARESIGAALAMDEYGNRFWSNSAIPRGLLKTVKSLSDEAQQSLRAQWEAKYRGSKNANKVAVLEDGLEWQTISMPLEDAQFIEQRKWSVQEAARWFRVPVSLIEGDKGSSLTYSTVEADNLHFATHSVRPWTVRIEQALAADPDLFPPGSGLYPEFLFEELLRTDAKTQAEVLAMALDPVKGWMNREEARRMKNLPAEDPAPAPATTPAPAR